MKPSSRVPSIDALRGIVMIIMALDHVRDFFHRGAMTASPTDLATTTPILFATRWITHVCAPAFALTAGLGAWFWWQRGRTRAELSRFLATRGLWLMLLELTVMRFGYGFTWSAEFPVFLLVFWSLGLSMVALAALIWLPVRLLGTISVLTLLLHPFLDAAASGSPLWNIIHRVGAFPLGDMTVITPYPLIPWVAVMSLGFSLGPLFTADPAVRRKRLLAMGTAAIAGFLLLRLANGYGDTAPWARQDSPLYTVISFLNTTKYPASPAFLLMTLGPAFLLLAMLERRTLSQTNPVMVFGRVPLFYFIIHFYLAHLLASAAAFVRYGAAAADFAFLPFPSIGGNAANFPEGFGYPLAVTYAAWIVVLIVSYPLCRWYAGIKARRRDWWLSYL